MNIKRWMTIILAALVLVACGTPTSPTVARVDNVTLTRQELDQRIDRIMKAQQGQTQQQVSRLDLERAIVGQFVRQNITLGLARQRGIAITDQAIDTQIEQFRTNITQSGSTTLEDAVTGQLGLSGSNSPDFRQFVSWYLVQQQLGQTLVTTDTVRQQVTDQVMAEAHKTSDQVHSAHILVDTEAEAQQVLDRLAKGEKFEDLAKQLSKDTGSATNGGDLGWVGRGQFVPEFEKAIFDDLKPGETTKQPVKSQFGYHIIKVIERAERPAMTDEQAQQLIEQTVASQLQNDRQTALQKLIDDETAKAKAEGRLIQPDYPTPTPEPTQPPVTPEPQQQPATQPTGEPATQPTSQPAAQPTSAPAPTP